MRLVSFVSLFPVPTTFAMKLLLIDDVTISLMLTVDLSARAALSTAAFCSRASTARGNGSRSWERAAA